ncbi:polycystic kidney disease and receptor for egg jelly-related protein-like [Anneissia japonica]|uniref:polycystic kidney disease and receptor for egg jelly-related protein-like n=1 Tax=Anneissia japonica TaxID=1529436 RepID=UPI001425B1A0|nr:polycystic kidney disease and receptor for egg jelly-related protein-like [Anneissia japonica]
MCIRDRLYSYDKYNWKTFNDNAGKRQSFLLSGPDIQMFHTSFDARFIQFNLISTSKRTKDFEFVLYGCKESGDIYLTSSDATDVQINIEYFNLLNSVLVSANASFVEEISDFEIEPQQYIGYGYDGVIQGTLSSGSHLKFEVKMDRVNLTSYLNEDYLLTQTLAITFTPNWTSLEELKNFSVIVTIDNVISYPVSLSTLFIVQYEVTGLNVSVADPFVETNKKVHISYDMIVGSHLNCSLDVGDDDSVIYNGYTFMSRKTGNASNHIHTYKSAGVYIINVSCYNQISYASNSTIVTIQNSVGTTRLKSYTEVVRITSLDNGIFNISYHFKKHGKLPTDATASYDFIDSNNEYTMAQELDFVPISNGVLHSIDVHHWGSYSVNINIYNMISSVKLRKTFEAENIIENLEISSVDYARVNERIAFNISVSAGSRITYMINFMDGSTEVTPLGGHNTMFFHQFISDGLYKVTVNASNLLEGQVTRVHEIMIQFPVDGFEVKTPPYIKLDVDTLRADIPIVLEQSVGFNFPTGAQYSLEVNSVPFLSGKLYDLNTTIVLVASFNITLYQVGLYHLQFHIWNLVSYEIYETSFEVLEMISGMKTVLTMNNVNVFRSSEDSEIPKDDGKLYLPRDHALVMSSKINTGCNVTYTWTCEPDRQSNASTTQRNYIWFATPDTYTVTLNVSNPVSYVMFTTDVVVQETVIETNLIGFGPSLRNTTTEFKLDLGKVGTDACYHIDFIDNTSEVGYIQYLGFCKACNNRYGDLSDECTELNSQSLWQTKHSGESVKITIENKFMTHGVYLIELIAFNQASYLKKTLSQVITKLPCFFPNVSVAELNACTDNFMCDTSTQTRQYYASVNIFILAEVQLDCKSTQLAEFVWKIYQIGNNKREIIPSDVQTTGNGLSNLVIPAKTLFYGTYMFSLTVSMVGEEGLITTDSTNLGILPTPLHVGIDYGTFRTISWNRIITLDASDLTYDPDLDISNKSGMNFTWQCRRKKYKVSNGTVEDVTTFQFWNDKFTELITDSKSNILFNPYKESTDIGGCLGRYGEANGHVPGGVLNVTGPVVVINTFGMYWNMEYEIRLTVWKNNRNGTFKQIPVSYTHLDVCKLNCKIKKNPTNRLSIEAKHNENRGTILYYRWRLFMYVNNFYHEIDESRVISYASTGIDVANLSLEPGFFIENTIYRIELKVSRNSNFENSGVSKLDFETNDKPVEGNCEVEPTSGIESATEFIISCENYKDDDIPLLYQFSVRSNDEANWALIYSGYTSTSSAAQFPAGSVASNYSVAILVRVADSLGSFVENDSLSVQVLPAHCTYEEIFEKYTLVFEKVASIAGAGGFGSVCNIAISISGYLNRCTQIALEKGISNGTIKELQKKTREELLRAMSTLNPAKTLGSMNQMSSALDLLTMQVEEITPVAMRFVDYLVGTFTKTITFVDGASAEEIEESAKLAFNSLGRLRNNDDSGSNDTGSKVIQFMTDSVTTLMVTGQSDIKIASQTVAVTISKMFTTTLMNGTAPFTDQSNQPIMILPDIVDLFGDGNDTSTELQVQVTARTNNPYGLEDSNVALGSMISLDMKNDTGQSVIPANPNVPFEFMITLNTDALDSNTSSRFDDKYSFHETENGLLSCQKVSDVKRHSAVTVEVMAYSNEDMSLNTTYDYNFDIFLKINESAFEDNYDLSCTLKQRLTTHNNSNVTDYQNYQDIPWNLTLTSTREGQNTCLFSNTELSQFIYSAADVSICVKSDIETGNGYYKKPTQFRFVMGVFTSACYYRSGDIWQQKGCEVGNKTTDKQTQCFCLLVSPDSSSADVGTRRKRSTDDSEALESGVATFSGGLAVHFNSIDLTVGLSQLAENPVVFAFLISCLCFYFVVILWARKEDKRDALKAGVCPMIDNDPCHYYNYEITFFTGVRMGSGTSANVFFILNGEQGQTGIRAVKDKKRSILQRSSIDSFLMTVPSCLGTLVHLRIWHDNSGNAKWFLSRVTVKDLQTNRSYYFMVDKWFCLEEDDEQIERVIPTASLSEITSFGHLFHSRTRRNLSDAHIWLSVYLRPAKSTFTRCQRATCCLSLLFCTMMANILLYQPNDETGGSKDDAIKIGSFEISVKEITIGVISSLMVFPINLGIVQLFRLSRPRQRNQSCFKHNKPSSKYYKKKPSRIEPKIQHVSRLHLTKEKSNDIPVEGAVIYQQEKVEVTKIDMNEREMSKRKSKVKKEKPLPWWCLYIGWSLSFLAIGISMWLTIGVAANFGAQKAEQWLKSICVSLCQDILISQPIKVILLATFYSLVIKSPDKEEDCQTPELKEDEEWLHQNMSNRGTDEDDALRSEREAALANAVPPDSDEIENLKRERQKDLQMHKILKEITTYLVFLFILIIVTFGNISSDGSSMQKSMVDAYINADYHGKKPFYKIYSRESFWEYLDEVLVPSLYSREGYNGTPNQLYEIERLVADRSSSLLSTARLQQVRVQKDYCQTSSTVESLNITCKPPYSFGSEEERDFMEGWILLNKTVQSDFDYKDAWKFKGWYELENLLMWGMYSYYGGGGYVANLGKTESTAQQTAKYLRQSTWVDQYTRAVFLEFAVYNPPTNLFGVSYMLVEFPPTGGAVTFYYFQVVLLDQYLGALGLFVIICEVVFSLFILLFLSKEVSAIRRERKKYFKKPSNLIELSVLILSILALISYINRYIFGVRLKASREEDISQFINFQIFASWEQMYYYILGFILFISTAKFLKLLRFNRRMLMLSNTIGSCWLELIMFLMVFMIVFAAYASCGYLLFSTTLNDYSSFITTLESLFATLLGKFDFLAMQEENRVLGAVFFFSFMMTIVFVLMNLFLTIINEAFSRTREDNERLNNELEIVDFMVYRFKLWTGFKEKRIKVPRKKYNYIEGVEPMQRECDTMQQKLILMVDKLNEFIRHEKSEELGIPMNNTNRIIFTT